MRKIALNFILIIFLFLFLFNNSSSCAELKPNETRFYRNDLVIKVFSAPPDDFKERKKWAFDISKPYLAQLPAKITVLYLTDDNKYLKSVSVSNSCIRAFMEKKLSKDKFLDCFKIELIDLTDYHEPQAKNDDIDYCELLNLMKSQELKELAFTYELSNKFDESINLYKQAFDLNSKDYIVAYKLATLFENKLDYKNALIYYKKTLEINPDFQDAKNKIDWIIKQYRGLI